MFDYSLDLNVWLCSTTQIDFKFLFSSFLFQVIVKIDYLNISSSYSLKKKKKNSSSLPPTFPLSLCLFISLLLFTLPLNFLRHFLFLIYWLFFSLSYFVQIWYHLFHSIHIFSTQKLWVLSLSLNFCSFL